MKELLEMLHGLDTEAEAGTLQVESGQVLDRQQVAERITEFAPEQGWLQFTDRVILIEELAPDDFANGRLLAAELVCGESSLHLRQQGQGWRCWDIRVRPGTDLILRQDFLGTSRVAGRKLRYQTSLVADERGVLQPHVSRFVGFVEGGN